MSFEAQAAFYRENGYVAVPGLFDPARVAAADAAFRDLLGARPAEVAEMEPEDASVPRRIWAPDRRHPFFHAMARDPALLDVVEALIGPNIVLHYTKLNAKGPQIGSAVEWHQEFSYNPHTNTDLVVALVYLDDATVENGCLQVMPGTHRGPLDHRIGGYFRGKVDPANLPDRPIVPVEGEAGTVVFLHCLVLHGSLKNTSTRYRRSFLPAYSAADAFPIYCGPQTADLEPHAAIVRGAPSLFARAEAGTWALPIAEAPYNSLYELQEGSHVEAGGARKKTGYFGDV